MYLDTEKTDENLFSINQSSPIDDWWLSGLPQFPSISIDRNSYRWRHRSLEKLHWNEEVFTWTKNLKRSPFFVVNNEVGMKSDRRRCVRGWVDKRNLIDRLCHLSSLVWQDWRLRYPHRAKSHTSVTITACGSVSLLASSVVALFFISCLLLNLPGNEKVSDAVNKVDRPSVSEETLLSFFSFSCFLGENQVIHQERVPVVRSFDRQKTHSKSREKAFPSFAISFRLNIMSYSLGVLPWTRRERERIPLVSNERSRSIIWSAPAKDLPFEGNLFIDVCN